RQGGPHEREERQPRRLPLARLQCLSQERTNRLYCRRPSVLKFRPKLHLNAQSVVGRLAIAEVLVNQVNATVSGVLRLFYVIVLPNQSVLHGAHLVESGEPPHATNIAQNRTTAPDVLHARELHLWDELQLELDGRQALQALRHQCLPIQGACLLSKPSLER